MGVERNRNGLHKALKQRLDKMDRARTRDDAKTYMKIDQDFHQALIEGARNQFLIETYQAIGPRMATVRNKLGSNSDLMRKTFAEHQAITEHVAAGDVDQALAVLTVHIGRKEGSFWNV